MAFLKNKEPKFTVVVLVTITIAAVSLATIALTLTNSEAIAYARTSLDTLVGWASQFPAWAFTLIIGIGCSVPIPSSPFFIMAGTCYGLEKAITATAFGLFINLSLSYLFGNYILRVPLQRYIEAKKYKLPKADGIRPWEYILIIRMIPIPLVMQSYVLGILRSPFIIYLSISWPISMLGATGLILAGNGIARSSWMLFVAGALWIAVIGLIMKHIKQYYDSKYRIAKEPEES